MAGCYRQGRCWPISRSDYDDNTEARGFVTASASRGSVVIYGALFGVVAANTMAETLADCEGLVFGTIKASSVVSTLAAVEGVFTSLFSPMFGGIADVTPHRKLMLLLSFSLMMLTVVMQSILFAPGTPFREDPNDSTKLLAEPLFADDGLLILLMAVFAIQTIDYEFVALLQISYAPELTLDEEKQHGFIADSYVGVNGSQLAYVLVVTGLALGLGLNAFESGTVGGVICLVWCCALFAHGYPKLSKKDLVPDDANSKCFGACHLKDVLVKAVKTQPDLIIFLIAWAPIAASNASMVTLATSYLQFHLNFSSLEIQALLAAALLFTVPGSFLCRILIHKFSVPVKKLYVGIVISQGISFIIAPFLLVSSPVLSPENGTLSQFGRCPVPLPDTVIAVEAAPAMLYIAAAFILFWGLSIGMVYPTNAAIYSLIIPGGQEVTYFGIKTTFAKCIVWLPPLIFTVINESGSLQFSITGIGALSLVGGLITCFVDVERAQECVKDTLQNRRMGDGKVVTGDVNEIGL